MKRLTISMSDDLFESLSKIRNKSLFVRNLIEQGLDAGFGEEGDAPSSKDLDVLRDEIGSLTNRLHELEDQIVDMRLTLQPIPEDRKTEVQSTPAIETKSIQDETTQVMNLSEEPVSRFPFVISDINPTEEIPITSSIAEPEKQSGETASPPFAIPDSKLTEEPTSEPFFSIPGFEPAEEIPAGSSIEAPEKAFDESVQPPFTIPGSGLPEKTDQFSLSSPGPDVPLFETPLPETVSSPTPSPAKPADKKDRLEGNILMYMPHGSEIKRDIVKSLLSTRFDSEEIDAKINQMMAENILSSITRDGRDYLIRL